MSPDAPRGADESWLTTTLRAQALALAAAALLSDVALPQGAVGAVAGTLLAALLGRRLARARLRLPALVVIAALVAVAALLLAGLITDGLFASRWFGVHGAMALADTVRYGLLALLAVATLRVVSIRLPTLAILELAAIAFAFAGVVAAHRDGAINQPRALSDWAWSSGRDPARILLYVGLGVFVALIVASLRERRGRGGRVVLHLVAAAALAALVLLLVRVVGVPATPRGGGLEGSGRGRGSETGAGGGGAGGGGRSNELEFRDDYSSPAENAPVAVVLLHDDYSPPLGYYYFRQTAFSQYNGHRLVTRTRDDVDTDLVTDFSTEKVEVKGAPKPSRDRVEVRTTVALLADHLRPFGLETPLRFEPRQSSDPVRFQRVYGVTSAALAMRYEGLIGRKASADSLGAAARATYSELPNDPRYRELADRIVGELLKPAYRDDPFAQAVAISAWLGKHSTYSMKSKHADAVDPTADFLFGDRVGYCVHFSHAAAFLLRARGLPARIASGYIADEARRGSGSTILLRQKDAHAWAELYLDGFGWIIVDVAPERTLDPPDTPPDPELQRLLGELARGDKRAGKLPSPTDELARLARAVARVALWAVTGLLALLYLGKLWRALVPLVAGPRHLHRVAYRAALDRLVEAGHRRRRGETREDFARRTSPATSSLPELTREHVAAAFGGVRRLSPGEMRRLARTVAAEARRAAPLWRRLLGPLDPSSWLRAR